MTSQRPTPVPDDRSAPYWTAAADHVLALARCSRCGRRTHPPDVVCPLCRHPDPAFTFEPVSGGGTIRSWVVLRQSFLPGFEDQLPLVLVDVALDEEPGIRLIGRLLDGPGASLTIGQRVRVAFEDLAPGTAIPAFTLEQP
ncbi:MAG: Zn-ribbon domain-containing OB-fold protein [Acidimicrobiales bacterium]